MQLSPWYRKLLGSFIEYLYIPQKKSCGQLVIATPSHHPETERAPNTQKRYVAPHDTCNRRQTQTKRGRRVDTNLSQEGYNGTDIMMTATAF